MRIQARLSKNHSKINRAAIAAQLMAALLSNPDLASESFEAIARDAVAAADALIAELGR